jgi:chromosome segregation ATPase
MASIDKAMVDVAENRMLTLEEFAKAVDEKTEERLRNELKEWKALGADSPSAMATILSAGAEGGRTYASMLERLREENEQLRNAIKEQAKTESGIVKQFRQRAEKAESETESLRAQMESWRDNCEHLANCSEPYPKCEQCASLRLYFRGSNSAS